MAKVKCAYCHREIDKKDAIAVKNGKRNKYYCCQEHVNKKTDRELFYMELRSIIISTSTILYKEMDQIAQVHDFSKMLHYIQDNSEYLQKQMNKSFNSEYGRIRYFSTILKNNLGDYKYVQKNTVQKETKPQEIYETNYKQSNQRRGLDSLLDDLVD